MGRKEKAGKKKADMLWGSKMEREGGRGWGFGATFQTSCARACFSNSKLINQLLSQRFTPCTRGFMDRKPWLIPRPTALAHAMYFLPFYSLRRVNLLREILSDLRGKSERGVHRTSHIQIPERTCRMGGGGGVGRDAWAIHCRLQWIRT